MISILNKPAYAVALVATLVAVLSPSVSAQSLWADVQPPLDSNAFNNPDFGSRALVSAPTAFGLSLILPGLGHRYVNGGSFGGWGTAFAITDAGLWLSLFGSEWHRDHLIDSYTSLAAAGANANVQGKDRTFFLNLATYQSSDAFLETVLRNRAWDQIDYVESPSFQWNWTNDEDFFRYRALREDSESLRRRRGIIIASLVANRIISGIMSAWRASRLNRETLSLQFTTPPPGIAAPTAKLMLRF